MSGFPQPRWGLRAGVIGEFQGSPLFISLFSICFGDVVLVSGFYVGNLEETTLINYSPNVVVLSPVVLPSVAPPVDYLENQVPFSLVSLLANSLGDVVIVDSEVAVVSTLLGLIHSPVAHVSVVATFSVSSPVCDVVLGGGPLFVVPGRVVFLDSNFLVNSKASPSHNVSVESSDANSISSADDGDVNSGGVGVDPLVEVPISVISNANLQSHIYTNNVRWQCDWLHDDSSSEGKDTFNCGLETGSPDNVVRNRKRKLKKK